MKIHRLPARRPSVRFLAGGFTLVEIMIVILILGVLLAMAAPSFVHARDEGRAKACIVNLKRISGGKEEYALENKLPVGSNHTFIWADLSPYISGPQPTCPANLAGSTAYVFNTLGTPATCPYGAPATYPTLVHQYNF